MSYLEEMVVSGVFHAPNDRVWSAEDKRVLVTLPQLDARAGPAAKTHEIRLNPRTALVGRIFHIAKHKCKLGPAVRKWWFLVGSAVHNYVHLEHEGFNEEVPLAGEFQLSDGRQLRLVGNCDFAHLGDGRWPPTIVELKYTSWPKGTKDLEPGARNYVDRIQANLYRMMLEKEHRKPFNVCLLYICAKGPFCREAKLDDSIVLDHLRTWWAKFENLDLTSAITSARSYMQKDLQEVWPADKRGWDKVIDFLYEAERDNSLLLFDPEGEENNESKV